MNTLATIAVLGMTLEALIEYSSIVVVKRNIVWKQVAAIAGAIFLALVTGADLFSTVGVSFRIPFVGEVLTGVLFSRGANYVADFIKLIQTRIGVFGKE